MAGVALVVGIPLTLVIRDSGDEEESARAPQPRAKQQTEPSPRPRDVLDRGLGVRLKLPKGWEHDKEGSVINVRSPDKRIVIGISAPSGPDGIKAIGQEAILALRDEYKDVHVSKPVNGKKLGGIPARTVAASAVRRKDGAKLQILVATAEGKKKGYLLEVFVSGEDATRQFVDAQNLLNNLRLVG
jgi:hypothetical protein